MRCEGTYVQETVKYPSNIKDRAKKKK